jgi:hypothetical protein
MSFFSRLGHSHNELKRRIHAFRIPLGPKGRFAMGCVYFSVPFILGYPVYRWSLAQAEKNIGVNGSKLRVTDTSRASAQRNKDQLQALLTRTQNGSLGASGATWAREMDGPRHAPGGAGHAAAVRRRVQIERARAAERRDPGQGSA